MTGKLKELRNLKKSKNLALRDIADCLDTKISTVKAWFSVGQTRPIPDAKLRLLRLVQKGCKEKP
jgi:DNA-binding transcriptional regulator YiaG